MKQTWLVTGGSSDVARALFDELDKSVDEGTDIYAQYYSHEIDKEWKNLNIRPVRVDLSRSEDVDGLIEIIKKDEAELTHIIHLAAIPYEYVRIKEWDEVRAKKQMQVSLYSFAALCKAMVPDMARRRFGKIVVMLTDSVNSASVPASMCEYISVKYALKGYAESLKSEYSGKNIDVHMLYPGMMETKFLKNINPRIIELDAQSRPDGVHMTAKDVAGEILELLER